MPGGGARPPPRRCAACRGPIDGGRGLSPRPPLQMEVGMTRLGIGAFVLLAVLLSGPALMAQAQQPATDAARAGAAILVNLNTATSAQLETLPGVGPKLAARIIEQRQKTGGFKKIEELMNVMG
ncbi:MAG: helix-hairpin-helix domain-containing protein, partial [Acidobacteria bacterium]|nr:helix-hairpin-helix domain-containing protein [Acidobacteriota bacterium]